ncbi:ribosome hibernation-promoting factor, HPF/YfiA family [Actinocorallia longicatena]|uniref:Ribosome hibernation promoting factor n=1 Tax=Actinocorallia longicatena TaxID=111803 RepID=A0ABP6QML1_9ACTN
MDIIVKGRRTEVNDRFKRHLDTKLARIEKLDSKIIRIDVEVTEERNPRQADQRERVELTLHSKGPVIRAEAAADDRYGALDLALDKLDARLRKTADRRKVHTGRGHGNGHGNGHGRNAAIDVLPEVPPTPVAVAVKEAADEEQGYEPAPDFDEHLVPIAMDGDGPVVVREKVHKAAPMDTEQALYEMELVGHDFFLFCDKESGKPSVVYRRRGWDYGIIRLIEE